MNILEPAQRQAVIAIAESWIGTPFHDKGQVKGPQGGVDCAMFLLEVFREAGLIHDSGGTGILPVIPSYSPQWHLHRSEEKYLEMVLALGAREIFTLPAPADLILWRVGRTYSHGAIVVQWPAIIHAAAAPIGACLRDNALSSIMNLNKYARRFFSAFNSEQQTASSKQ